MSNASFEQSPRGLIVGTGSLIANVYQACEKLQKGITLGKFSCVGNSNELYTKKLYEVIMNLRSLKQKTKR